MRLGVLLNGSRVPECPPHGTTSEQSSFRQFLTNWLPCFGLCDHATLAINNQSGWDLAPDHKGAIYKLVLGTPETCEVTWHRSLSVQDRCQKEITGPTASSQGIWMAATHRWLQSVEYGRAAQPHVAWQGAEAPRHKTS